MESIIFNMYANSYFARREFAFDIVKIPFPVKIFKHQKVNTPYTLKIAPRHKIKMPKLTAAGNRKKLRYNIESADKY